MDKVVDLMDKFIDMDKNLRITILVSGFFLSGILVAFSGDAWFLFFILTFSFLGLLIYTNKEYDDKIRRNSDNNALKTLSDNKFKYDEFHIGDDKVSAIALNENDKKIALLHRNNLVEDFNLTIVNFEDIIESAIVEDGETVMKSSKGSTVAGALIGGALAGGVGAVIGGLNSTKTSKEKVKKVSLLVVVDSLSNPIYEINYLNSLQPMDKSNPEYKEVYAKANKWHKMMSVILKRNELNIGQLFEVKIKEEKRHMKKS